MCTYLPAKLMNRSPSFWKNDNPNCIVDKSQSCFAFLKIQSCGDKTTKKINARIPMNLSSVAEPWLAFLVPPEVQNCHRSRQLHLASVVVNPAALRSRRPLHDQKQIIMRSRDHMGQKTLEHDSPSPYHLAFHASLGTGAAATMYVQLLPPSPRSITVIVVVATCIVGREMA